MRFVAFEAELSLSTVCLGTFLDFYLIWLYRLLEMELVEFTVKEVTDKINQMKTKKKQQGQMTKS